ncbi:MAG: patatin-like phospholipase family protein [Vicinamibacterales bacterium]
MLTTDSGPETLRGDVALPAAPPPVAPSPGQIRTDDAIITSEQVKAREVHWHIGKGADEPLVGLAFSGGGIRSATFGLGVLQALHSLGIYRHVDYLSTVSGGGYIGGWLQAVTARGRLTQALCSEGQEPRDIRFLRAYSNYLTPRLGLFSGDTWAAVGNSARNLLLNFSVLSLSLLAPLYVPWLAALFFWRMVPSEPSAPVPLTVSAVLLAVTVGVSTLNMARPLRDGTWSKAGALQAPTWQVQLLVVLPALAAAGLISTVAWTWARNEWLRSSTYLLDVVWRSALAFGAIWLVGALSGYLLGARRVRRARAEHPHTRDAAPEDLRAAGEALVVLVLTAMAAGAVGSFVLAVSTQAFVSATAESQSWLTSLFVFPIAVVGLLVTVTVHIGLAGRRLSDETREWWGRVGGTQLLLTLLLVVLGVLALGGPDFTTFVGEQARRMRVDPAFANGVLGAIWAAITGAGVWAGKSERTANGGSSALLDKLGQSAPLVFVIGYLIILATLLERYIPQLTLSWSGLEEAFTLADIDRALATLTDGVLPSASTDTLALGPVLTPYAGGIPPYEVSLLITFVLISGVAWFTSWRVDLNEFSLHALYRNRLVRCYLGASNERRSAHPFTGFDSNDDVPLAPADATHRGLGEVPRVAEPGNPAVHLAQEPARIRPYPIFNAALNLVGGKNLAWQQRKAASFIFSPEYCGFEYRVDEDNEEERRQPQTGAAQPQRGPAFRSAYAPTAEHAGDRGSLTVGLAIATSGAAASPNMGYHSSPTLAFLMTIFNVRLGWWLRNPRWRRVWRDARTGLSLRELLSELLGMTTDDRAWVYLSDGGHFENLGVYELVRRRCRFIIVSDAGQDGSVTFEDLGNMIEKCRADFGVDIEMDLDRIRRQGGAFSQWHCAIGTIRYDRQDPADPPGTLLYLKSSLTGDEPADVLRYASMHPAFPHESTADQFFDESQFESYRALGYHIACAAFTAAASPDELRTITAVELFTTLRQQWTQSAPAPQDAIRKYSTALSSIWATVRTTKELAFLDEQMFPEWMSLMLTGRPGRSAGEAEPRREVNYWLPHTAEERRAGFYICSEMLQLMEDVYLEFKLDEHYDHIDNRGWMNLFQHWAWSGMLGATFAITGSNFDPRFQRFCLRRLGLKPGEPYVASESALDLPDAPSWRLWRERKDPSLQTHVRLWQEHSGLNFLEATLIDRFLHQCDQPHALRLVPLKVVVESPRRSDGHPLDFNVGFMICDIDWPHKRFGLHHMRVQNHLRKMGLARAALSMVALEPPRGWGLTIDVHGPTCEPDQTGGVAMDEAVPTPTTLVSVQRIVRSLPREEGRGPST